MSSALAERSGQVKTAGEGLVSCKAEFAGVL